MRASDNASRILVSHEMQLRRGGVASQSAVVIHTHTHTLTYMYYGCLVCFPMATNYPHGSMSGSACTYAHVCTHAHTYARTHTRMHARTLGCTHTRTHTCTHARTHARKLTVEEKGYIWQPNKEVVIEATTVSGRKSQLHPSLYPSGLTQTINFLLLLYPSGLAH